MPKVRSPNRDKAYEMYKSKNGNIPLVEIAKQIGETDGTVRGWKSKDKWDEKMNGTFQTKNMERSEKKKSKNKNVKKISSFLNSQNSDMSIMDTNEDLETDLNSKIEKKRGAPKGNKNAVGNIGGSGAPVGNKYALTTGEYETILFGDIYDETELRILSFDIDEYSRLKSELRQLDIKKRRMEQRIKVLSNLQHENKRTGEVSTLPIQNGLIISNVVTNDEGNTTTTKSALDEILKIEDGLTRIHSTIVRVSSLIHKMELDAERMEIEKQRLEIYRNKMAGIVDLDVIWGDEIDGQK